MRPMHTFRQASRKIAATTTVPAAPKCAVADAVSTVAPLVAPGTSAAMPAPTYDRPQ